MHIKYLQEGGASYIQLDEIMVFLVLHLDLTVNMIHSGLGMGAVAFLLDWVMSTSRMLLFHFSCDEIAVFRKSSCFYST